MIGFEEQKEVGGAYELSAYFEAFNKGDVNGPILGGTGLDVVIEAMDMHEAIGTAEAPKAEIHYV